MNNCICGHEQSTHQQTGAFVFENCMSYEPTLAGNLCFCILFRPAPKLEASIEIETTKEFNIKNTGDIPVKFSVAKPEDRGEKFYRCDKCYIGDLHKARQFLYAEKDCGCPCSEANPQKHISDEVDKVSMDFLKESERFAPKKEITIPSPPKGHIPESWIGRENEPTLAPQKDQIAQKPKDPTEDQKENSNL